MTYRSTREITLLFGINLTPNFKVGYAYDQNTSPGYSQNGTHEIMVEYRIPRKAASTRCQCENRGYWYQ